MHKHTHTHSVRPKKMIKGECVCVLNWQNGIETSVEIALVNGGISKYYNDFVAPKNELISSSGCDL